MLLPYCNGVGPFQPKPWPLVLGQAPFPMGPLRFPAAVGPFRHGISMPPMVTPLALPRPLPVPPLALTAPIRPPVDPPRPKISPPPKKLKLFRPWDDESDSSGAATGRTTPSSTTSTTRKLEDLLGHMAPGSPKPPGQPEDPDQSKSAFEVFATNLGKSPDGHRCIYCGKMYSRKYGLKIHLRTHTGFKPLKCKVCQRPFGDPSNLNKHVRLHADVLLLANAEALSPSKKHSQTHDDHHVDTNGHLSLFKCPFCGRSLVRKRDLERHLASRHPQEHLVDVERL